MDYLIEILYPVIDDFNATLTGNSPIDKSPDTPLLGELSSLDSIRLVSFIVAVEDFILEKTGKDILLADEKAMSRRNSPFRNLKSLSEYLSELIGKTS